MEKLFEDEVEGEDDEYENEGKGNPFATVYRIATRGMHNEVPTPLSLV